jgi:asparaginyl-tRNA synthetase
MRRNPVTSLASGLRAVSRLRNELLAGFSKYFQHTAALQVRVPTVVGVTGACENIDTLYEVTPCVITPGPRGQFLSQTGQLYLESALAGHDASWCITTSYRADKPDRRHLQEFELIEHEFSVASLADDDALNLLLETIELAVRAAVSEIDLQRLEHDFITASPARCLLSIERIPRITYGECIELLNEHASFEDPIRWGDDLGSNAESAILDTFSDKHGCDVPVFVTHYPTAIKFFNMKTSRPSANMPNSYVLSADLLLPTAGESVGAAVREDDANRLRMRLRDSSMLEVLRSRGIAGLDDFEPYLALVATGMTPPHAGYGIGLERVMQFCTGAGDIRSMSMSAILRGVLAESGDTEWSMG